MTTLLLMLSLFSFNSTARAEELRCIEDTDELWMVRRANGIVTIALIKNDRIATFSLPGVSERLSELVARGLHASSADGDLKLRVEGGHTIHLEFNGQKNAWWCESPTP